MTNTRLLQLLALSLVLIAALGLSAAGGVTLMSESANFLRLSAPQDEQISAFVHGSDNDGISLKSRQTYFSECRDLVRKLSVDAESQEAARDLATACLLKARQTVAVNPAFSFGHYAVAFFAAILRQDNVFNDAILLAQGTGANEMWLAALRVELADARYEVISDTVRDGQVRDIQLLATTGPGSSFLARRYVAFPDSRERITEAVDALSQGYRQFFVENVNNVMRGREGSK